MTWARAAVMIRWSSFAVSGPMEIRNSSMRAAISAWGRLFITCHSRSERRSYSARTACSAGSIISPEGRRSVARKMSECETRPRLARDDGGAGDVAFVLLDEGLLDRFQGELVGDDLLPRIALPGARHHVEGAAQVLGLVVGESEDAAVAEDDPGRIELGLPAHVDVADLEVRSLGRGHAQALVDDLGLAHQLHHDVAAPVVGELLHRLDAVVRGGMLAHVDHVGGPEGAGEGEALLHPVDDDHARRAHLAGHRARVDSEAARALDHYRLALAQRGEIEACVDLAERAVDAGGHVVGDVVGELEYRVVRSQVEVLAEAVLEVRPYLAGDEEVRLAHRAGLGLALQAGPAAPAREEEAVGHAVAHRERPP